ncbi:MAG TPA: acyl-CoA dehydrogenase family protein [Gemmatimonadaceae bacterium]|nr:acyl-CoA dehydrogenase family protein [Gemmatimonadaceae bacterium]
MSGTTRNRQGDLAARTESVAREVAVAHASDVDAHARFPHETFDAARRAKLLAAAVPADLGGLGAGMGELAAMCTTLAQACGSSGMVLAMHHIQVACMARHGRSSPFFRAYLGEVAERQLLLASVTSEVGTGGETRSSICAVAREGARFTLNKDATTVSYGEYADDLLVTSRRAPDAAAGDQVLVLLRKGDYVLRRTGAWDTLGMRGTCSPAYEVRSSGPESQIVPGSFADSSAQSMVPYSHILWSAVWLGIASDAVARASAFVRADARRKPGTIPPSATRLAEASVLLQCLRQSVGGAAAEFDALGDRLEELSTMAWALKLNNLKIAASELAPRIVHQSLQAIGIMGYKNDSEFSVGRHYRDTLSAPLMISNDRIAAKNASMLLVFKDVQEQLPPG